MRVRVYAKRRRRCIGPQVVHGFDAGCGPPSHPATQPPSHPGSKLSAARRAHRLAAPRSVHKPRCIGRRDTICGGRGGSRDITCTIASRDIDRWWQLVAEHDLRRAWGDVAVLVVSCYRFHPGPAPPNTPLKLSYCSSSAAAASTPAPPAALDAQQLRGARPSSPSTSSPPLFAFRRSQQSLVRKPVSSSGAAVEALKTAPHACPRSRVHAAASTPPRQRVADFLLGSVH